MIDLKKTKIVEIMNKFTAADFSKHRHQWAFVMHEEAYLRVQSQPSKIVSDDVVLDNQMGIFIGSDNPKFKDVYDLLKADVESK